MLYVSYFIYYDVTISAFLYVIIYIYIAMLDI